MKIISTAQTRLNIWIVTKKVVSVSLPHITDTQRYRGREIEMERQAETQTSTVTWEREKNRKRRIAVPTRAQTRVVSEYKQL